MNPYNGKDIEKVYFSLKKGDIIRVRSNIPAFQKARYYEPDDEGYFIVHWKTKQQKVAVGNEYSEVGCMYFIHIKHISGRFKLKISPSRYIQHFTKPRNTKAIKILYG